MLREMGSHELDRARHLTGWHFTRLACSLRSAPGSQDRTRPGRKNPETFASVLAETSDGAVGNFRLLINPGQPERRIVLGGVEGTLTLRSQWVTVPQDQDSRRRMTLCNERQVVRQRSRENDPVVLQVADSDRQPDGVLSGQHTWNRLIADFVSAVRNGDRLHCSVPHLPHISDGLDAQRLIRACELSNAEGRWIELSPDGALTRLCAPAGRLDPHFRQALPCRTDHWRKKPTIVVDDEGRASTNTDGPPLLRRRHGMKPTRERGRPAGTSLGTAWAICFIRADRQRRQDICFGRAHAVPAGRVAGCPIAEKLSGTQRDSMRAGRPRSRVGPPPIALAAQGGTRRLAGPQPVPMRQCRHA